MIFNYRIHDYSWEVSNKEEDKCELLEYLEPDDERIIPYVREVIWLYEKWEKFSENHVSGKNLIINTTKYGKTNQI